MVIHKSYFVLLVVVTSLNLRMLDGKANPQTHAFEMNAILTSLSRTLKDWNLTRIAHYLLVLIVSSSETNDTSFDCVLISLLTCLHMQKCHAVKIYVRAILRPRVSEGKGKAGWETC